MTKDNNFDRMRVLPTRKRISSAEQLEGWIDRDLLNRAYVAYAKAMNAAQHLEVSISLLLLGVYYERSEWENLADCEKVHDYLFRNTLGKLIQQLKKVVSVPSGLEGELSDALNLRNFLAHHYFSMHFAEWLYPAGLRRRIKDLKQSKRKLEQTSLKISRLEQAVCRKMNLYQKDTIEEFRTSLLPKIIKLIVHDPSFPRKKAKRLFTAPSS